MQSGYANTWKASKTSPFYKAQCLNQTCPTYQEIYRRLRPMQLCHLLKRLVRVLYLTCFIEKISWVFFSLPLFSFNTLFPIHRFCTGKKLLYRRNYPWYYCSNRGTFVYKTRCDQKPVLPYDTIPYPNQFKLRRYC